MTRTVDYAALRAAAAMGPAAGVVDFEITAPDRLIVRHRSLPLEAMPAAHLQFSRAQRGVQKAEAQRVVALLDFVDAVAADAKERGALLGDSMTADQVRHGALLEVAQVMRMSERGAAHVLDTARTVRLDLPQVWLAFVEGHVPWRIVDIAHRHALDLDLDQVAEFDSGAAFAVLDGSASEVDRRLHRLREQLHPEQAAGRRRRAERDRGVHAAPLPDGQASLTMVGPAEVIAAIDDGAQQAAVAAHGHPDETRCVGALRFDALADVLLRGLEVPAPGALPTGDDLDPDDGAAIALGAAVRRAVDPEARAPQPGPGFMAAVRAQCRVPQRKGVTGQVLLVLPAGGLPAGAGGADAALAMLAGYGPIDPERAGLVAADSGTWTRLFRDPATGTLAAVDAGARTITAAHKAWLRARDETCRAPGCSKPALRCDLDHTVRREHAGPTAVENLAHLCRRHHHVKDDGMWQVAHRPDGTIIWTSRWGTTYMTEPVMAAPPVPPARPPRDDPPPF